MNALWELILLTLGHLLTGSAGKKLGTGPLATTPFDAGRCLSWRVAAEANNVRAWPTVSPQCLLYVEDYMLNGQYEREVNLVVDQILSYVDEIETPRDAWVLDVDDTCLSNLLYYKKKHFGGDQFDPIGFKIWAEMGICPAIPAVLALYKKLVEGGFKVFLVTGRDEELLGASTAANLFIQGFIGHERLIMRSPKYRGERAVIFKSAVRKQLEADGYRIRGNVGDQWSDLMGDCVGDRTFKLPNAMYYVP